MIVEPPLVSDLASWQGHGLIPLAHHGGILRSPAYEPVREIAWIAAGSRLESLAIEGEHVQRLGRSPALPAIVSRIAVGDGVVLALDEGHRRGLWLVDGRDPAWPRDVRRLRFGALVTAMAIEGRTAVIAAGDTIIELDLTDPARPRETALWAIPDLHGSEVAAVAVEGSRIAALLERGTVLVSPSDGAQVLEEVDALGTLDSRAFIHLEDSQLVAGSIITGLRGYDLREPPRAVWTLPADPSHQVIGLTRLGSQLTLLLFDRARDVWLRAYRVPEASSDPGARPTPLGPHRLVGTFGGPGALTAGVAGHPDRPFLLIHDGDVWTLPRHAVLGSEDHMAVKLRPRVDTVLALAGRGDRLALAGRAGRIALLDVRQLASPRVTARWSPPLDADPTPDIRQLLWHVDTLWAVSHQQVYAIDVADPARPSTIGSWMVGADAHLVIVHDTVRIATRTDWLGLVDGRWEGEGAIWSEPPIAVTASSDHLWVATHRPDGAGTTLWGATVLPDGRLIDPVRYELPKTVMRMLGLRRHLLLIARVPDGSIDSVIVFEAAEPGSITPIAALDLGSHPGSFHRPDLVAWRDGALVAQSGTGLVYLDLSLPSFPDERARLSFPRPRRFVRDDVRIHTTGDVLWLGSWYNGLVAAHAAQASPESGARLWLPFLGDPRNGVGPRRSHGSSP